jgi:hypothetical protein
MRAIVGVGGRAVVRERSDEAHGHGGEHSETPEMRHRNGHDVARADLQAPRLVDHRSTVLALVDDHRRFLHADGSPLLWEAAAGWASARGRPGQVRVTYRHDS